jgi:tRNA/rRNA methyltransferase
MTRAGSPVRVVLVRPRNPINIGAACRAMKNMGAGVLYVVEGDFDPEQARPAAVHGSDVLEARREVATLADALVGCSLVVGTTARGGGYRERSRDVRDLAVEIAAAEIADDGLVPALVFGPEDAGLSNRDIALCHRLAFIQTGSDYASLNLAQAVLVCLYEVLRARAMRERSSEQTTRADAAAIEDMYRSLEHALVSIGFLPALNPEHVMMTLRDILGRAGLDERELRVLRGIARQILWFAEGGRETARQKRERGERLK